MTMRMLLALRSDSLARAAHGRGPDLVSSQPASFPPVFSIVPKFVLFNPLLNPRCDSTHGDHCFLPDGAICLETHTYDNAARLEMLHGWLEFDLADYREQ